MTMSSNSWAPLARTTVRPLRRTAAALTIAAALSLAGASAASASSPVPLQNAIAPDPALSCAQHIPNETGFSMHYSGIQTPAGVENSGGANINSPDSLCHYYGVSNGSRSGFPSGVPHVANTAIDWSETCSLTTQSASGASSPAQAGDGSWWCLP